MKSNPLRFLTAVIFAVCCCTLPAWAFSSEPAPWAAEQVEALENAGLLSGTSPSYHAPTDPIHRGAFCQILVNLIELEGIPDRLATAPTVSADYFADISSSVSGSYPGGTYDMYYAAAYGLTDGTTENGRRVADCNGSLTREQAAKMMCSLVDALEHYADIAPPQTGSERAFADQSAVSAWAEPFVVRAAKLGLMQGDGQGQFLPRGTLSWQEACVMIERCYQSAEQASRLRDSAQGIQRLYSQQEADSSRHHLDHWHLLQNNSVLRFSYDDPVTVERFDASGAVSESRIIPMELEYCGGFYENEDSYFLVFHQGNSEENDSKELIRIVRYDKNWNRLGSASITGGEAFSISMYSNGKLSLASQNGILILHTARTRYVDNNDGVHHQSNLTVKVRISDMSVIEVSPRFPQNHVSHSFAQYVQFDPDTGLPVYADHGDAYPRGFALNVENSAGESNQINFFRFAGETGDNTTNAIPGGLGIGSDNYLFAGASSAQKGNDSLEDANAFLAVIPKDDYPDCEPVIRWLTQYPAGSGIYVSEINLTQVNNNTFVVMWNNRSAAGSQDRFTFSYAVFDGQGNQIGDTMTKEGFEAPDTPPVVSGNEIRWVGTQRGNRNSINLYSLEVSSNAVTTATTYTLAIEPARISMGVGKSLELSAVVIGSDGTRQIVDAEYTSDTPAVVMVDYFHANNLLLAQSEGGATITAACSWRGELLTATVPVSVAQGEIGVIIEPKEVVMHVGETFQLDMSFIGLPPGAHPTVRFHYSQTDGLGISISSNGRIEALKPCTKTVTASFDWERGTRPTPATFTVIVLP